MAAAQAQPETNAHANAYTAAHANAEAITHATTHAAAHANGPAHADADADIGADTTSIGLTNAGADASAVIDAGRPTNVHTGGTGSACCPKPECGRPRCGRPAVYRSGAEWVSSGGRDRPNAAAGAHGRRHGCSR